MDSISTFTKQYCKSTLNMICAVLLALMAVVALAGIPGIAGLIIAAGFALMAALTYLFYTHGSAFHCTLLQIPLAVLSFLAFFAAITMSALGFVIVHYGGMYDYINEILSQYGYVIVVPPQLAGALLGGGGLAILLISLFAFCAVKYLGTVKRCLNDEVSRHGAGIFSAVSILLFLTMATIVAAFVFYSGGLDRITADGLTISVLTELALLTVLFLLTGISANAFINSTQAFKVFEDETMKVETNADGTVYVPLHEDSSHTAVPVPKPISTDDKSKKKFIKVAASLDENDVIDGDNNEYDII